MWIIIDKNMNTVVFLTAILKVKKQTFCPLHMIYWVFRLELVQVCDIIFQTLNPLALPQ